MNSCVFRELLVLQRYLEQFSSRKRESTKGRKRLEVVDKPPSFVVSRFRDKRKFVQRWFVTSYCIKGCHYRPPAHSAVVLAPGYFTTDFPARQSLNITFRRRCPR